MNKQLFALAAIVLICLAGPVYSGPFDQEPISLERSSSSETLDQPESQQVSEGVLPEINLEDYDQELHSADDGHFTFRDMVQICFESYQSDDDYSVLPRKYQKIHSMKDDVSGFQAIACINKETGKLVVCYTGTGGPNDVVADLGIVGVSFAKINAKKKLIMKWLKLKAKIRQAEEKMQALEMGGNKAKALWYSTQIKLFEIRANRVKEKISKIRKELMDKLHMDGMTRNEKLKKQVEQSRQFLKDSMEKYRKVKPGDKEETVVITGHSLGGFLAQVVGASTGHTTVTFNAPGAQGFFPELKNSSNIHNYVRRSDIVGNFGHHIGRTEYIEDARGNKLDPTYILKNHGLTSLANDF